MSDTFVGPLIEYVPGGDQILVKPGGSVVTTGTGAIHGAVQSISVSVSSGTAAATTAVIDQIASFSQPITVRRVALLPFATCAGHATSNFTLAVHNIGTGATGTTVVADLALTTGNAIATNVPKAFTLSTTTASLDLAAGEALGYHITLASLGIDFPKGKLTIDYVTRIS